MDASVCNDGFSISEIVSAWHNGEMQACGHLNGGACEICKDRLARGRKCTAWGEIVCENVWLNGLTNGKGGNEN